MRELNERNVGWGLGLLGGLLFAVGSLVAMAVGAFDLALGHPLVGIGSFGVAVAMLIVGGLAVLFSWFAHGAWKGYPLTPAIGLLVIGTVGALWLGFGNGFALLGGLAVFLGGILFLVPSAVVGVKSLTTG